MVSLNFCGSKCSHCCFVISLWGILMLTVLGVLFNLHSRALMDDAGERTADGMETTGTNCYIAAGMYLATAVLSYWQMWLSKRTSNQVHVQ
eukprot:m.98490 g.98490  ORF g.98490 m.98490 type:complete len:91 (+) comp15279_c0_seq1:2029-2301(+)